MYRVLAMLHWGPVESTSDTTTEKYKLNAEPTYSEFHSRLTFMVGVEQDFHRRDLGLTLKDSKEERMKTIGRTLEAEVAEAMYTMGREGAEILLLHVERVMV